MHARSPARFLAPLALLAALAAIYLVVQHSDTGGSSNTAAPVTHTTAKKPKKTTTSAKAAKGPKTYTVQSGDTLTTIASRTKVSADQISELNPKLDPQALVVGTKIKLRP